MTPRGVAKALAFLSLLLCYAPARADLIVYTNRAAWEAAEGGIFSLEDFEDNAFGPGYSRTDGNGIITTGGFTSSLHYNDNVDDVPPTGNNIAVFNFTPDIFAFGGDWDLNPGTPGIGIRLRAEFVGGGSEDVFIDNPSPTVGYFGFFGITSSTLIDRIVLIGGRQPPEFGFSEIFDLDNIVFSSQAPLAIPEPASMSLAGVGFIGLTAYGWLRRKRVA